jgi:hypothetical protein
MQLKPQLRPESAREPSIRQALTLAACTLLSAPAVRAQATWEADSAVLLYSEQDRVKAVEPVVRFKRKNAEDDFLSFQFVADSLTGASPSGAVPSRLAQTFTSPSGGKTYTTPANRIPLDPTFLDTRGALSFEWGRPLPGANRMVLQGQVSKEYDYLSSSLGATFTRDFNQRNTTLAAGVSIGADSVDPVGGIPVGLAPMPAFPAVKPTSGKSDTKRLTDVLLGVTQVLSSTTLVQLNYTRGAESGYLTDPYKLVSVVDTAGDPVQTLYEKRPDTRARNALYGRAVTTVGRDVVNLTYRYTWDDWGLHTHTAEARYRFEFGGGHYLEPQLRWARQSQAADFFRPYLRQGESVSFASADYRLSAMTTRTLGLKYGIALKKSGEFALRAGYMLQTGEDRPAGAPGQLAGQDLFPDTKAVLLQVNYALKF